MQGSKRNKGWITDLLLNVVLPLLTGFGVYLFIQPSSSFLKLIRYYLPDGAWAWALGSAVLIIHERRPPLVWLVLCFVLTAGLEAAQYYDWIAGTADWFDVIICYICLLLVLLLNPFFRGLFNKSLPV